MEMYKLNKDIEVFFVKAPSFPAGVMAAYDKLHALLPPEDKRMLYGISHSSKSGEIIYLAAAEAKKPNEGSLYGCESFVIRKGNYTSEIIKDFMKNLPLIGETFQKMLQHPQLDPNGYCVEVYFNESDVQCLVKLQD
jgi:predicted transcriptional regulator YdeE